MKTEKLATEERVAHTPQQKDLNLPWHVYSGGNFDKVVPEGYDEQVERTHYLGGAICEMDDWNGDNHISPQARTRATERAAFIVTACNAHEALVDALRAAIELPKRMRDACHKDMMRVIELCMLDLPEGEAKEAVRILGASVDEVEGFGDTDETELIAARAALSLATQKENL